jgi:Putative esterase
VPRERRYPGVLDVSGIDARRGDTKPTSPGPGIGAAISPTVKTAIHSAILNEDRSVIIHLPASYASAVQKRYPVMSWTARRRTGQPRLLWLRCLFGERCRRPSLSASLLPAGTVPGITHRLSCGRNRTCQKVKRVEAINFLLFVEKELIPFIDNQYRTSTYRMINGNSRGGLLVLYSLLEKPELFKARFCYSSPFHREETLIVNRTKEWLARNGL